MSPTPSSEDIAFMCAFEAGSIAPPQFGHRDHLRLAYVYLCDSDVQTAGDRMRAALGDFLALNNVPPEKYHETLTISWVMAVRHFMDFAGPTRSFEAFLAVDDRLLDKDIMLTHYQRDTLFSDAARLAFVPPDRQTIPPVTTR